MKGATSDGEPFTYSLAGTMDVKETVRDRLGRVVIAIVGLLAAPFVPVAAQQSAPAFEVASVKSLKPGSDGGGGGFFPGGRFAVTGTTVQELIRLAYGVADYQVLGAPGWITTERYVVDARARTIDGAAGPSRENVRLMLQSLLAQRFRLIVRRDTREMPAFSLEIAREDVDRPTPD